VGHVKRSNVNTVYLARAPWILHTCGAKITRGFATRDFWAPLVCNIHGALAR
jgi:hypothetical protein